MIPSYLTPLDRIPLTAHRKTDKAALPRPETIADPAGGTPPRTILETVLAHMYATILAIDEINADDSFFDIGGNSIQVMQLITELRNTLAVNIDVATIFLAPTPQQLAASMRDKHGFDDADLTAMPASTSDGS
jgi:acyl carrier protein